MGNPTQLSFLGSCHVFLNKPSSDRGKSLVNFQSSGNLTLTRSAVLLTSLWRSWFSRVLAVPHWKHVGYEDRVFLMTLESSVLQNGHDHGAAYI